MYLGNLKKKKEKKIAPQLYLISNVRLKYFVLARFPSQSNKWDVTTWSDYIQGNQQEWWLALGYERTTCLFSFLFEGHEVNRNVNIGDYWIVFTIHKYTRKWISWILVCIVVVLVFPSYSFPPLHLLLCLLNCIFLPYFLHEILALPIFILHLIFPLIVYGFDIEYIFLGLYIISSVTDI